MSVRSFVGCILLASLVMPVLPRGATAEQRHDWPQFRGPNRDGVSHETRLLQTWPDDGPPLLWTADGLGHGFPTASIADGMIYTAGDEEGKTLITALELEGRLRWQVANGPGWVGSQPGHPGARGVPTIDGGQVFHLSPFGHLIALDAATGQRQWGLNILDAFQSENVNWALAASVLVDDDRVIVAPGGPSTAVVALDRRDGRVVWESPSVGDLAGYGSPIVAEHQGLRMIVTLTDKAVIAVRAADGGLLWRFPHETRWDENIFTPIHHDGHVFVSTQFTGSVLLRLLVDGDTCAVEQVWRSEDLDNHHGGVVLLDGYLYGSGRANGGRWACLDWKTGETKYLERGVGKGSVVAADGMLYTLSERGVAGLVPATPDGHAVVSEFRIPDGGEGPVFAHPVVCGGRLYLRHGQHLYCYDIRAGG
jgi:outer membrane protein assembly factor BamB